MAAATVRGASNSIVPRNECLTQKARPIKPTVANKENHPRLVRPEKADMSGSRLPIPVKKLKIKSVPDFKKLHQNWDQKFQKKQAIAKKACTQPVPFNFGTSRGSKSTLLMSTDQNIQVISVVTRKESAESEESYPVHAKCVMAAKDQAAVESKPTQNPAHQECRDLAPSIATLKLDQSEVVNKENYFVPWQANATPSKTKSFYIQSSAPEIKLPSPPEKAKIEIVQNENIKPNTGNSDEDFESNPMALQSILSNVGINAFNVISGKLSLAHTLSMKTNIQNYKPSNLNPGNNDGMALRNAPSTLDDENTFSNPSGKPSMAMRAPVKDNALHCKYPAQSPYVMGRSSYMPCNRPTLPLAWGRASCIAKLGTRGTGTEISSPSSILQPIKLYNQVSSRQHFSAQKSARCKPDGLDFNLMDRACESNSSVASTFVSAGGPGTLKPDAKDLEMQTPNRVLRPPNHHFSSTRAPSSQNLWHPRYMPAPPTSVDQIVLRLFNDSEDPNEVEKATETPSLKEELERPKSKQDPSLVDLKLVKLKNIELLSQQLQKEMQEVKVIEETLIENGCEANAPVFLEEHPNLAGAVLKSRPIATALKQQEAEERVLPSHCTALTSKPALKPVDCSIQTNSVSGAANSFPTIACQSKMLLPSTELALNMMDTLPTPIFHSSSRLYTTAQGLKFQSPFCSGSRDRSTLLWASMKQRFSQVLPGCRKPSQEAFLDEEVSCCLARAFQSPEMRINRERNCTNPVAKILEQQEVMHFVPIELHHQPEVSPTIPVVYL
ncbi:uncharacterized protein LOC121273174 isoform X2 [Carcharodon carcharias]|uniref:uncharacterized protein LOC121273174 isoform X2 n=1 Tax=Carcharodon carcharias TaxID=13397 RepID=UPI001B7F3D7F|nr:uncharacterized protein LOC121273174 isoform X2 [Carcharodon carcharias]